MRVGYGATVWKVPVRQTATGPDRTDPTREERDVVQRTVADVMTPDPTTVDVTETIQDAARLMPSRTAELSDAGAGRPRTRRPEVASPR